MKKLALALAALAAFTAATAAQEPGPGGDEEAAARAAAREQALAGTDAYLASLTAFNEKAAGSAKYAPYFMGRKIGSVAVSVSKEEADGAVFYAVVFEASVSTDEWKAKDLISARLKADLSPVSMKFSQVAVENGVEKKEEFEVSCGEKITIAGGEAEPASLDRPARFTAGFPSFLIVAKTMDFSAKAAFVFNAVNTKKRAVVEYSCTVDPKKVLRKNHEGKDIEVVLVSFAEAGKDDPLVFWSDGKGAIPGFEMSGMTFLAGNPEEMPEELPAPKPEEGAGKTGPGPKEVVVECLKGIYSADRKALEGVFDFEAMYARALGDPAPKKENVEKFKEGLLAAFSKRNDSALKSLDTASKSMAEEVAGEEASVTFEGKVIASLHRKDGRWLICWIKP